MGAANHPVPQRHCEFTPACFAFPSGAVSRKRTFHRRRTKMHGAATSQTSRRTVCHRLVLKPQLPEVASQFRVASSEATALPSGHGSHSRFVLPSDQCRSPYLLRLYYKVPMSMIVAHTHTLGTSTLVFGNFRRPLHTVATSTIVFGDSCARLATSTFVFGDSCTLWQSQPSFSPTATQPPPPFSTTVA